MTPLDRIARTGAIALPLVPGLSVALYWILSVAAGESLSVAAIYRYGDYTYFPSLAGLAQFSMGESLAFEHLGEGVRSFPLPSLLVHGLAFGVFGPIGLVLADVGVAVAVYFAARRLFLASGLSVPTALILTLVVSCALLGWDGPLHQADRTQPIHLWGLRFPRPFLTDLFLMLCVGSGLRILVGGERSRREWAVLGLWFGCLLQSRFYSAGTVGLWIGLVIPLLALRPSQVAVTVRGLLAFGGVAATTCLPFLIQRLSEHPDIPVRLGAFEVDRLRPLFLWEATPPVLWASAFGLAVAALVFWAAPPKRRERIGATASLLAMAGLSLIALPASIVLLGQTIQPYHFQHEVSTFKSLLLLVSVGHVLDVAATWLERWRPSSVRLLRPLVVAAAVTCLVLGVRLHGKWMTMSTHMRPEFAEYAAPNYRDAFRELTTELSRERYADARVLGTLDIQVLDWWSLFGGMHVLAPDAFGSSLGDDESEERLLRLLAELGASEQHVWKIIHNRTVLAFFLGGTKYQFNAAHTFAPIEDYPPRTQAVRARISPLFSWHLVMPTSEAKRLIERYRQLREGVGELHLDVIVLGPGPLDRGLAPSPDRFSVRFRNEMFRVYQRVETGRKTPDDGRS
jgi:hypothetical protein